MFCLLLLSILSFFVLFASGSNIACDDASECSGSTLTTDDNVYCRGYLGCKSATITAGKVAYCTGDEGCESATIIGKTEVRCQSEYSCKYATISKAGTKLQVYGVEGLRNATAKGDGSTIMYGYGFYSSRYAKIYNMSTIYGSGLYGLAYSKIYSTDLSTMNVYSLGTNSGYQTRVYCYSGSTCYVDCGNYYGCKSLTIYCYSGATCSYSCDTDDCSTDTCPTETSESMDDFMYAIEQEFGITKYDDYVKYYDSIADGYEKVGIEKEEYYRKILYPNDEDKAYREFNIWFNNYVEEENNKFFGRLTKWGYHHKSLSTNDHLERRNNVLDTVSNNNNNNSNNNMSDLLLMIVPAVIAFVIGVIITRIYSSSSKQTDKNLNGYGTLLA